MIQTWGAPWGLVVVTTQYMSGFVAESMYCVLRFVQILVKIRVAPTYDG
jgi:hypothetical protein